MEQSRIIGLPVGMLVLPEFRGSLVGLEITKALSVALLALIVYEYALTLNDERKHFWKGPYSISHYLFFFNRYFPVLIVLFDLICFFSVNPSVEFCQTAIPVLFLLTLFGVQIIQAILTTRVWYLFPGARVVRLLLIFAFLISASTSLGFLYVSASQLEIIKIMGAETIGMEVIGCRANRPPGFWRIWLPSLVLHTFLYGLTVYDTLSNPDYEKKTNIRKRLLRDGGAFYIIVLLSVGFTSVGSFITSDPKINIPAIYSPVLLATTSIATSRIMFSLRAATLAINTSLNANFEWLPMPSPDLISEKRLRPGSVPRSRFSFDSDVVTEGSRSAASSPDSSPVSTRSVNRFLAGLGERKGDEEMGTIGVDEQEERRPWWARIWRRR